MATEEHHPRREVRRRLAREDLHGHVTANGTPYPVGAPRHIGLVAEAVLAGRAEIRAAVASLTAPPASVRSPQPLDVDGPQPEPGDQHDDRVVALPARVAPVDRFQDPGDVGRVPYRRDPGLLAGRHSTAGTASATAEAARPSSEATLRNDRTAHSFCYTVLARYPASLHGHFYAPVLRPCLLASARSCGPPLPDTASSSRPPGTDAEQDTLRYPDLAH
jgi:hypothetical protein